MKVKFLLSTLDQFPHLKDPKGNFLPEVAMAGRSNVGKSSLINHWLGQKVAKTSATPGKTKLLNFFLVEEKFLVVDLPGYGYAKAARFEVEGWSQAIDRYLNERKSLKLILLLIDSRREIKEEDQCLIDWAKEHKIPLLLIFTKTDKLSQSEKMALVKKHPGAFFYTTFEQQPRLGLQKRIQEILWG
jgi:GTP-binding protein